MARAKFDFTPEELNRKTKIILFLTDDKKVIYEENKAYWQAFKRRRVLNIDVNLEIASIKHYAVQTLALNSMRSIDLELLPEEERAEALLTARNFFKNGLISVSSKHFGFLNSDQQNNFLKEKNGIDILIHLDKSNSLILEAVTDFAKETNREIWWAFNSFTEEPIIDELKKYFEIFKETERTVYYNPLTEQLIE